MIDCISVETMRLSDAYTIENHVSGRDLMYRAALGVFQSVDWSGNIAIVVGSGNNGGDGFALACILRSHGLTCTIFALSDTLSADSAYYAAKARKVCIPIRLFTDGCLQGFDMVADCLLGTGFHGTVREAYAEAITAINRSGAFVVSVDINSGMNGDTGEAEIAVFSDLTVTIGFVKRGLVTQTAGAYIKKLICVDIGIILVREDAKICAPNEELRNGDVLCPPWLDPQIRRIL